MAHHPAGEYTKYRIDPDGLRSKAAKLPPATTKRWAIRRKAQVVNAVQKGIISLEEACRRYMLTADEFAAWERAIDEHGLAGLRTTRLQQYRGGRESIPPVRREPLIGSQFPLSVPPMCSGIGAAVGACAESIGFPRDDYGAAPSDVEFVEDEARHVANDQHDRQPEFRRVNHRAATLRRRLDHFGDLLRGGP